MNNETNDRILLAAIAVLVVPSVAASMLPKLRAQASAWLLENSVLVPAERALFEIPGMGGGPDLRRVVITVLVLAAAAILATRARAKKREAEATKDKK